MLSMQKVVLERLLHEACEKTGFRGVSLPTEVAQEFIQLALTEPQPASKKTAKQRYDELMPGETKLSAVERLRFFCSLAMQGQDWLDAEPFFDDALVEIQVTR